MGGWVDEKEGGRTIVLAALELVHINAVSGRKVTWRGVGGWVGG